MGERRTYSRTARKQLSSEDRNRLIEDMLGGDMPHVSEKPKPAATLQKSKLEDSFEALDALDAEFDEELSDIRGEKTAEQARAKIREHNALVEEALFKLSHDIKGEEGFETTEAPSQQQPEMAYAEIETTPLAEDISLEQTVEPAEVSDHLGEPTQALQNAPAEPAPSMEKVEDELEAEPPVGLSAADLAAQKKLRDAYNTAQVPQSHEPADLWNKLAVMPVNVPHLEENLVITASRNEPAHGAFDVLRTRLVHTLLEHGWKRVAITSPSRNCGKTFTAVNLAISLSRYEANRTILLDMDMRNPSVAGVIGDPNPGCMGDFLRGVTPAEDFLVKFDKNNLNIGSSLAIGTNGIIEPYAAELAQDPATGTHLDKMMQEMSPDIVLFDMPPALAFDDVIAFRKQFDGVLMVVGGGSTSPEEVREVMRRLGEDTPLLGVVLNQAEGEDGSDYSYGY